MAKYTKSYYTLVKGENVKTFNRPNKVGDEWQTIPQVYVELTLTKGSETKQVWTSASIVSEDKTEVLIKLDNFNLGDWTIKEE